MKFATVAVALLSTSSGMSLHQQAALGEQALAQMQDIDAVSAKTGQGDKLGEIVTQALAGAPPGEIAIPLQRPETDMENDVQMTKGKTINYEYFWKYACAWTRWVPTN